ncbi:MAG: C_GCAxxG_C_C family protein [Clostridia bacterium]|jgi:C_GCAxxG_C_C family probable redox protein|nr:C_GCAxxG_C_C family protein [Clostridia bacterium]
MSRAETAKNLFFEGYNCAQAVMLAFADALDIPQQTLKAAGLPMGGGMGRLRQTCGGVSGAAITAGLLFPDYSKNEMYALVQELAKRFQAKNGSINCGELLSGAGVKADTLPQAEARTQQYYKKRPCPDLIYDAAEILEEICKERGRL